MSHATSSGNRAYVQVHTTIENVEAVLTMRDYNGVHLIDPIPGEIPDGYYERKIIFDPGIVAYNNIKSYNGFITADNINLANETQSRQYILPAAGWWRIAKASAANIGRNSGKFMFEAYGASGNITASNPACSGTFSASCINGSSNTSITQKDYTQYSANKRVKNVSIVTAADGNYCYLEVYSDYANTVLNLKMLNSFGWELLAELESGDVLPSGATRYDLEFNPGMASLKNIYAPNIQSMQDRVLTKTVDLTAANTWYSIAKAQRSNIGANAGTLHFRTGTATPYCAGVISATCVLGATDLTQLAYSYNTTTKRIPKARVIHNVTNEAYLQLLTGSSESAATLELLLQAVGWVLMDEPIATEAAPAGFTLLEITLDKGIVALNNIKAPNIS